MNSHAQSESVALQPGLARDCAAEREQHCAGVQPGQSRVFNCLIANARQVGAYQNISAKQSSFQLPSSFAGRAAATIDLRRVAHVHMHGVSEPTWL